MNLFSVLTSQQPLSIFFVLSQRGTLKYERFEELNVYKEIQ